MADNETITRQLKDRASRTRRKPDAEEGAGTKRAPLTHPGETRLPVNWQLSERVRQQVPTESCLCYRNATRALLRLEWLHGAVYAEGHHVNRDGYYGGHGWLELGGELIDPTWAHFLLHPHPRFPVGGGRYFAAARFTRDEVAALFAAYSPAELDEDEGDVDWCTPLLIKAGYARALETNHPAWLAAGILAARAAWPGHDEVSGEEDRKKMIAALAAPPREAPEAILNLVAGAVARGDSAALDIRGLIVQAD